MPRHGSVRQPGRRRGASAAATRGFTFVELAVVIAIVGLLLGAVLTPLSAQLKVRKNRDAERLLRETNEALVGFALSQGRLPCPDTDVPPDGLENAPCNDDPPGGDNFVTGALPWATLDSEPLDPWGRILLYGVSDEFTYAALPGQPGAANQLDLSDSGAGNVVTRTDLQVAVPNPIVPPFFLAQTAPVVVLSTGANGHGGRHLDGTQIAVPTVATDGYDIGDDELENLNGDNVAMRRVHTPRQDTCDDTADGNTPCEYDDVVTWISGPRIIGLLVQAGRLP